MLKTVAAIFSVKIGSESIRVEMHENGSTTLLLSVLASPTPSYPLETNVVHFSRAEIYLLKRKQCVETAVIQTTKHPIYVNTPCTHYHSIAFTV